MTTRLTSLFAALALSAALNVTALLIVPARLNAPMLMARDRTRPGMTAG